MGRRGIPDRWLMYNPVGERIVGTPFIAFKVPLNEHMVQGLPEPERFTTKVLMESVPNIGLVIDLTNTNRYYNSKDFLGQGICYEKIFCRGHEIPSQDVVDKFFSAVDEYLLSCTPNDDESKLVGVHCTHGLNRTGYLVCKYMIRRLGFSPEDAISAFEKARGYPMERETYLKSLHDTQICSVPKGNDVDLKNRWASESDKDIQTSFPVRTGEQGVSSSDQNSWTHGVQNRFHAKRNDDFFSFSEDPRAVSSQNSAAYVRDNSFGRNSRAGSFSNFRSFSQNVRASAHPYHWENPEDRHHYNSRTASRRFYERGYDEEDAFRSRRQASHQSPFFRDYRQTSRWWRDSHKSS